MAIRPRIFSSRGKVVAVLVAVAAAISLALLWCRYISGIHIGGDCVVSTTSLAENRRGDLVQMSREICDGIAYSDTVRLELKKRGSTRPVTFFSYASDVSEPSAAWVGDNEIDIDLMETEEVFTQLDTVEGAMVRYRIGISYLEARDLARECASDESSSARQCKEFVAAVLKSRLNGPSFGRKVCIPQGTPLLSAIEITKRWLRAHPTGRGEKAAAVVEEALIAAFPCR